VAEPPRGDDTAFARLPNASSLTNLYGFGEETTLILTFPGREKE
jgi:hypothetical protein